MIARAAAAIFAATVILAAAPGALAQEPTDPGVLPLSDVSLGSPDAMVVVEEYASMTCSHCAAFSNDVMPGFKEKYIDTGKVRYVLKPMPLDPVGSAAFVLARCDADENFYPIVEHLFKHQADWAQVDDRRNGLVETLDEFGFDDAKLVSCIQNPAALAWIVNTQQYGLETLKLRATPTFVINGETQLVGNQSIDALSAAIDPLLE